MKLFVTGANGFVGKNLIEFLLARGHDVTAGVRSVGAAPKGASESVIGDIGAESDWSDLLVGHDAVIHLAARVHVMNETSANPLTEFRRVNTAGTKTLAQAAADQGVGRLVLLSTVKVNGESTDGTPFTVFDKPRPVDPYGLSKWEAEIALREIAAKTGLGIVVVRTPLVYGPGVGGNFHMMLRIADSGLPLPLASVRNRRTMISVWNLADLLESAATDPQANGAMFLAGDAESPSTAQMLEIMRSRLGRSRRLVRVSPAVLEFAGRLARKSAVIDRIVGSLDVEAGTNKPSWKWHAPYSFAESIERTVDWFIESQRPA